MGGGLVWFVFVNKVGRLMFVVQMHTHQRSLPSFPTPDNFIALLIRSDMKAQHCEFALNDKSTTIGQTAYTVSARFFSQRASILLRRDLVEIACYPNPNPMQT